MTLPDFNIVVAMDSHRGIGRDGRLPWSLPPDMKHFRDVTMKGGDPFQKNWLIMGRRTWESIPDRFRPLPGRWNAVLSRQKLDLPTGSFAFSSFEDALLSAGSRPDVGDIFVIGGGEIFRQALRRRECRRLYVTRIRSDFDCDVFFPSFEGDFELSRQEPESVWQGLVFQFQVYQRRPV